MRLFWILIVLACTPLRAAITVSQEYVIQKSKDYRFENEPSERTQPIVMGDLLYYANLSGEVSAVHRTKGYRLWSTKLPAGIDGALSYGRAKLFVGDLEGNLMALRSRDGVVSWKYKIRAEWLSAPVLWKDKVFVAASDGSLYAFDESRGTEVWYYPRKGDEKMTVRGLSRPTVFGSELYQGFADGSVVALDANTGREIWSKRLAQKDRFYDVDSSPYVDAKSVVVGTMDGSVYKLDRLNGEVQWVFRVGTYGGFLVEGNRIYFSGLNRNVYALDYKDGSVVWKAPFDKGVGLTPSRAGDYLVVPTSGDPVYLIDPKEGRILWTGPLGSGTLASAATDPDGWFFLVSNYGNLYAYRVLEQAGSASFNSTIGLPSAIIRRGES